MKIDFWEYEKELKELLPVELRNLSCNCETKEVLYYVFNDLRKWVHMLKGINGLQQFQKRYGIETVPINEKIEFD